MTELVSPSRAARPEFRNINALSDLPTYRLPPAGWVSILHRVSGAMMFILMPFIIWMFDTSLSSEFSFAKFTSAFGVGVGFVPGWFFKLVALPFSGPTCTTSLQVFATSGWTSTMRSARNLVAAPPSSHWC